MDVQINTIRKEGDASEEYILLDVLADCDIGEYLIADNTFTDKGNVSNKLRHVYWFPDKQVKKGELVSLRTGKGKNTTTTNNNGIKVHRFYWNLGSPVWNDDNADAGILMHILEWSHKKAP
ncbi:MAG TPA: hypothetical protein VF718_03175 [Allosphingosinicella sp.]|jgi:hypothetical protein